MQFDGSVSKNAEISENQKIDASIGLGMPVLTVEHGHGDVPGLAYILNTILTERLGVPYRVSHRAGTDGITLADGSRSLHLDSTFFTEFSSGKMNSPIAPDQPLQIWDAKTFPSRICLVDSMVPVIFGKPEIRVDDSTAAVGIDIFGSAFFMLSRYEETVKSARDQHDRFPAKASLAMQEGFLGRPIVDEYVEILWACMQSLWPRMERKQQSFRIEVSCDVDRAYSCGRKSIPRLLRQIGGDILVRKRPDWALGNIANYLSAKIGREDCRFDPYYSRIAWMMDRGDATGNSIAFFFICGHSSSKDGCYFIDEPNVRRLFRDIHRRGHEIGVHPSYNTYQDPDQLRREADNLRRILEEENIHQNAVGARQHYLRWDPMQTARSYEATGLVYDTTLAYAEHAGFRSGTCHEHAYFDLTENRTLKLRERPLIVMEVSVLSKDYMGLGHSEAALNYMLELKRICQLFDGTFTLLWHNENFFTKADEEFFTTLIS